GSWNGASCDVLGNGIVNRPCQIKVTDGNNNIKTNTYFGYDKYALSIPVGTTPQHVSITGSRGNLEVMDQLANASNLYLRTSFTHYDTGMERTTTDVNNAVTTYNFPDATSTCGNAFRTSVSEPLNLSRSTAWDCNGGVLTSTTDENGKQ